MRNPNDEAGERTRIMTGSRHSSSFVISDFGSISRPPLADVVLAWVGRQGTIAR